MVKFLSTTKFYHTKNFLSKKQTKKNHFFQSDFYKNLKIYHFNYSATTSSPTSQTTSSKLHSHLSKAHSSHSFQSFLQIQDCHHSQLIISNSQPKFIQFSEAGFAI
jgi:hypothetical protein